VRTDEKLRERRVILFMDNALIHRHSSVLETIRKFKVNILFNAEYSPWLNPIEQLFSFLKKGLHPNDIARK
jgi:transposase